MSTEQGDVEALEIARTLAAEGRGYGTWENRLAEALIACSAALEKAERELVDVEMDRRFQQDRARTAERELHEERERFHRHVETLIEPKLLARAVKAERALAEMRAALERYWAGDDAALEELREASDPFSGEPGTSSSAGGSWGNYAGGHQR